MKITGSHTLHGSPQQVWDALVDPEVLVRTLPGCRQLEEVAPNEYTATVEAGVASIKGLYEGRVALSDQDPPNSYTLKASGAGGPGTIDATATVTLVDEDGATRVVYEADAVVGGTIAGVGQRVLAGAAKRNAAEFFSAVDRVLTGEAVPEEEEVPIEAPEAAPAHRVFRAPAPAPVTADPKLLAAAALLGAFIALLGVLAGRRTVR